MCTDGENQKHDVHPEPRERNHALEKLKYWQCFDKKSVKWANFHGFSNIQLFWDMRNHDP
jgi:hypothetical protein